MKVVIIEYNAGNVRSVDFALRRLGVSALITSDAAQIKRADKVIFPGVGEAGSTMRYLRSNALNKIISELDQPLLGICLGLQLLCAYSEESESECLGIFGEQVKKFKNISDGKAKIPHMGWNCCTNLKGPLFEGMPANPQFYFVHSYYAECGKDTAAVCNYIGNFSAALQKNNFYAVQFHPEKSAENGEILIKNFLKI